jgi:hypothetical protein
VHGGAGALQDAGHQGTDLSALALPGGAPYITIRNNPLLLACEVEALLTRSGSTCEDCSGNDGAGTCD